MDLKNIQEIREQQKLILTPEMRHSLKVLQMPLYELQQDIIVQLAENPLLEVSEEEIPDEPLISGEKGNETIDFQLIQDIETDDAYLNFSQDFEQRNSMLDYLSVKRTLKDYLLEQALDLDEDKTVIAVCNYIIENIDTRGYLSCKIEELAVEIGIPVKQVNYALKLVQDFQPWGVAARDLKECLKIQLRKKHVLDEYTERLVEECLELIADNKVKEIAKKLNIGLEQAQNYCKIIKELEPKPGRGFYTGSPENCVLSEAYIIKNDNDFFVVMNERALPRLTINQLYKDIMKKQDDKEALNYVKNKLSSAMFLIKDIERRKRTIYSILEKIIELQKEYFLFGEEYLKPMTIANIAAGINLHESTVSRAIQDKYICTPFKAIKIKDLFSARIMSGIAEDSISVNLIKKEIRKLIEDKTRPLSDQDICDSLKRIHIELSRRTVAKYREEMEIGSSGKRKVHSVGNKDSVPRVV